MTDNQHISATNIGEKAFIFGGAYSNLQATQAILARASALGFTPSEIIFTGDMVAYCANPVETAELIRHSVDHIIMGNCEEAIAAGSNDCGCGFEKGTACSILSNQWYAFCLSKIDQRTANWMGSLPKYLHVKIGDKIFLVTHASPTSINQFIFPSNVSNQQDTADVDGYIVGHSGIPFISEINNKPWINSGASGMPANDGASSVWYATITNNNGVIEAQTHALNYNFIAAQTAMHEASLINGYADCLSSGIWPSHDVLPYPEKMLAGIALKPQKKAFKRTPLKETI